MSYDHYEYWSKIKRMDKVSSHPYDHWSKIKHGNKDSGHSDAGNDAFEPFKLLWLIVQFPVALAIYTGMFSLIFWAVKVANYYVHDGRGEFPNIKYFVFWWWHLFQ